ncbi:hypothetical protein RF11_05465 [Thelohanellus kitauei]|uniref:Triosephosphate isomerase n=1 Tax=Thelohanellus kitauei TaxID=669202 RepID=A0A0C2MSL1_THEKT|nr:hypothetical protein RF11_05465 [Thelohanellus kitauei]
MQASLAKVDTLIEILNLAHLNYTDRDIVVAPSFPFLSHVKSKLRKEIETAAQNCFSEKTGAYTGEVRYFACLYSSHGRSSLRIPRVLSSAYEFSQMVISEILLNVSIFIQGVGSVPRGNLTFQGNPGPFNSICMGTCFRILKC